MSDANTPCADGSCDEALAELEAFLDGELPADRLDGIREHLADCYPCTGRASFEEQLRAIVRRDCVDDAPPQLVDRIEALLASSGGGIDERFVGDAGADRAATNQGNLDD